MPAADRRDDREAWKESIGYHRSSLVETAMSQLKGTFGEWPKNCSVPNQIIEAHFRCKILNAIVYLGMSLSIWR